MKIREEGIPIIFMSEEELHKLPKEEFDKFTTEELNYITGGIVGTYRLLNKELELIQMIYGNKFIIKILRHYTDFSDIESILNGLEHLLEEYVI